MLDRAAEQERITVQTEFARITKDDRSTSAKPTDGAGAADPILAAMATEATMSRIQEQAQLLLGKEAGSLATLAGNAAVKADLDPAAAEQLELLMEYYAKHAPGAKSEVELTPVAVKCAQYGYSWLNGALKQKYGQSMDEFRRRSSFKAKPTPEDDTQGPMYVNDGEEFGFGDLSAGAEAADDEQPAVDDAIDMATASARQGETAVAGAAADKPDLVAEFTAGVAAYYAKHAPGQSSDEGILRTATRAAKEGGSWLDKALKSKYGETYSQFIANGASPAGAVDEA